MALAQLIRIIASTQILPSHARFIPAAFANTIPQSFALISLQLRHNSG